MAVKLLAHNLAWSFFVVALLSAAVGPAHADGFRIATKVYVGEEKPKQKPVSETTTLFLDGAVYDFLDQPEQIAVFRKPAGDKPGQFILLSEKHGILTRLSTEQVAKAMKDLRTWASNQKDPFLQFAAKPDFNESFDSNNNKLVLASHLETYTVTTVPTDHPDAMGEYKEYLDWYTQLNTMLSAGSRPPAPRLQLNSALARRSVVPVKVELARSGEEPLRAEHVFTWRLSQDDQKRIDHVRASLSSYHEVSNKQYLHDTQQRDAAK